MASLMPRGKKASRREFAVGARRQAGFSYLVVLFAVTIFGISLGASVPMLAQAIRQKREAAMIEQARSIARALGAYALLGQSGLRRPAQSLEDLLEDKRFGGTRRHLREIPWDAVSRSYTWGLVRDEEGGIIGVFSRSESRPLRTALPPGARLAKGAKDSPAAHYNEWLFLSTAQN